MILKCKLNATICILRTNFVDWIETLFLINTESCCLHQVKILGYLTVLTLVYSHCLSLIEYGTKLLVWSTQTQSSIDDVKEKIANYCCMMRCLQTMSYFKF